MKTWDYKHEVTRKEKSAKKYQACVDLLRMTILLKMSNIETKTREDSKAALIPDLDKITINGECYS